MADIIQELATSTQRVLVTPQAGVSPTTAAAAIPSIANQLTNAPNKTEVIVNGPMTAGRAPENTPLNGTTYSSTGAAVEDYISIILDGTLAQADDYKRLFDQGFNCHQLCGVSSNVDANAKLLPGEQGCDHLAILTKKIGSGLNYDIKAIEFEDITGVQGVDLDYPIRIYRSNATGSDSAAYRFNPIDWRNPQNYLQTFVAGSLAPKMALVDMDTVWLVPVKKGRKARLKIHFAKRFQYV